MIEQVAIGDCCQVINGSTPSRNTPEYWDGDIDWFTPKDLSKLGSKYIDEAPEKITERGYESCSTTMIPAYSILFTSRAPIGHIAINQRPVCTNQGFKSLVPSESVDVNYLYYVVKKYTPNLQDLGNGATFKELSKATVSAFKLPLPSLEEQKQIAAILDAADELRQKDKALISKYDELTQSLFLDMFGDPVSNPMKWDEITLLDVAADQKNAIVDGPFGSSIKQADYVDEGVPIIRINNVRSSGFFNDKFKYIRVEKYRELSRSKVEFNDILIARVGNTIGKTCVFNQNYQALLSTTGVAKVTIDQSRFNLIYIYALLSISTYRKYIWSLVRGAGQPYINLSTIKSFKVLNTPLSLQNTFAERMKHIHSQKAIAQESLNNSEVLFNSLLQKAFKGELTN